MKILVNQMLDNCHSTEIHVHALTKILINGEIQKPGHKASL